MPDFAMWGPEQAGERLAEFDRSKLLQSGLTALKTAGEIQQQPAEARLKSAHADYYEAEAAGKRSAQAKDQAFMTALEKFQQGGGQGEKQNPVDLLSGIGNLAMGAGDIKTGRELLNTASLLQGREATQRFRDAQAKRLTGQLKADQLKTLGNLFGTVDDQTSYLRAMQLAQSQGIPIDGFSLDYEQSKDVVGQIRDATVGTAKMIELGLKENEADARGEVRKSRLETDRFRRDYLRSRTDALDEKADRDAKAGGGKPAIAPAINDKDKDEARLRIKEAGISLSKDELKLASSDIASEAKLRVKRNPGLTLPQALSQVILEKKAAGEFEETGNWMGASQRYKKKADASDGSSKAKPLQTVPPAGERKPGAYYQTPKGIYRWGPNGWEVSSLSAMDHLAAADDDDDDDEELA